MIVISMDCYVYVAEDFAESETYEMVMATQCIDGVLAYNGKRHYSTFKDMIIVAPKV